MKTQSINSVDFDHLTINTGHCLRLNTAEYSDRTIIASMAHPGVHTFNFRFFSKRAMLIIVTRQTPGHTVFTVMHDGHPLVTCHACLDLAESESVWRKLITSHRHAAILMTNAKDCGYSEAQCRMAANMAPVRRPFGLYLTTHFWPGLGLMPWDLVFWLGGFEGELFSHLWRNCQADKRMNGNR